MTLTLFTTKTQRYKGKTVLQGLRILIQFPVSVFVS